MLLQENELYKSTEKYLFLVRYELSRTGKIKPYIIEINSDGKKHRAYTDSDLNAALDRETEESVFINYSYGILMIAIKTKECFLCRCFNIDSFHELSSCNTVDDCKRCYKSRQ